jgi:hypothetical protein
MQEIRRGATMGNWMWSIVAAIALAASPASSAALSDFRLSGVTLKLGTFKGQAAFEMRMPSSANQDPTKEALTDRDFMAWLPVDFHNGTIEVDVASTLAPDAPAYARGFIGVAFRIDGAKRFESIYLRPMNSIADDQVRRNHSVQYVAYPDYRFDALRKTAPETYETYADIAPDRWIHMKIVVQDSRAELYLDGQPRMAFLVKDLKLGPNQRGGIGVWLEAGTIAHFRNLRVAPAL